MKKWSDKNKKEDIEVLDEIMITTFLKTAELRIEPLIGNLYYLYKRADGSMFISLVEPLYWDFKRAGIKYLSTLKSIAPSQWDIVAVGA